MNQCISGWRYFQNPRMFSEYGRQKGWERENPATDSGNPSEKTMDGFVEVTEQMGIVTPIVSDLFPNSKYIIVYNLVFLSFCLAAIPAVDPPDSESPASVPRTPDQSGFLFFLPASG